MSYQIVLSEKFNQHWERHKASGQKSVLRKIYALLAELQEHPKTGTGKPEQLGHDLKGKWSRHITDKHRLIYEIHDNIVTVEVSSAWGHYGDK